MALMTKSSLCMLFFLAIGLFACSYCDKTTGAQPSKSDKGEEPKVKGDGDDLLDDEGLEDDSGDEKDGSGGDDDSPTDGSLYKTEKDVIVLTAKNFNAVVASVPLLLVEFYAPWCGHCKALAPKYAEAATELKAHDPPLYIAKLDAADEKNQAFAKKYQIQGFPSLLLFRNSTDPNSTVTYGGARTKEGIVDYMKKKFLPVNIVKDKKSLTTLLNSNEVVAMFYLAEEKDKAKEKEKKAKEKMVHEMASGADGENVAFGITSDISLFEESDQKALKKNKNNEGLILFKSFDDGKNVFSEKKLTKEGVASFINEHRIPLVTTYTQEKAATIFGGGIESHLLIFSDSGKNYHEGLIEKVKIVAKENKEKILHIYIPHTEANIMKHFNLEETSLPVVVLVHLGKSMKKFPYPTVGKDLVDEISKSDSKVQEKLLSFEKEYLDGKLKTTLNSQEPIDDSKDAVKTIVGKEFEKRVMQAEEVDVLLEFYAPWCGHCKSLAPKYEILAENLKDVKGIVVAKMDYTENEIDHPNVEIQGFPTIMLFVKGKKDKPILFKSSERNEEGLLAFLKENASPFELKGTKYGKGKGKDGKEKTEKEKKKEKKSDGDKVHEEL